MSEDPTSEIDLLYSRLEKLDTPLTKKRTLDEQLEFRSIIAKLRALYDKYPYLFDGWDNNKKGAEEP